MIKITNWILAFVLLVALSLSSYCGFCQINTKIEETKYFNYSWSNSKKDNINRVETYYVNESGSVDYLTNSSTFDYNKQTWVDSNFTRERLSDVTVKSFNSNGLLIFSDNLNLITQKSFKVKIGYNSNNEIENIEKNFDNNVTNKYKRTSGQNNCYLFEYLDPIKQRFKLSFTGCYNQDSTQLYFIYDQDTTTIQFFDKKKNVIKQVEIDPIHNTIREIFYSEPYMDTLNVIHFKGKANFSKIQLDKEGRIQKISNHLRKKNKKESLIDYKVYEYSDIYNGEKLIIKYFDKKGIITHMKRYIYYKSPKLPHE